MLSGDNGLLKRAGDARENTEIASTKEQILLEILGSYDKSVSLNLETLKTNLENIGAYVTGDNFPLKVSLNNHSYIINDNGELEEDIPYVPLTEEQLLNAIGGFADYNVPYTDSYYTSYKYTNKNGWRILSIEENQDETYNIEIISTGIPARVYFVQQDPTDSSNESYNWFGSISQVNEYYSKTFTSWNNMYYGAYYAAYGMKNNFTKIKFNKGIPTNWESNNRNFGYYDDLNGETSNLDTESKVLAAFKEKQPGTTLASKLVGIRNIEGMDIRTSLGKSFRNASQITTIEDKDSTGLFNLSNIKNNITHELSTYIYSDGYYWLASPQSSKDDSDCVWYVTNVGGFGFNRDRSYGVRPVISLSKVQITYNENTDLWELK